MTRGTHVVRPDDTLATARDLMRRHEIRHLPVLDKGKLAGVLSQRDIFIIESAIGDNLKFISVEDAMSPDAYCVRPDASMEEVAAEMAKRKYGCAVVMIEGQMRGIFTTTDALLALSRLLESAGAPA